MVRVLLYFSLLFLDFLGVICLRYLPGVGFNQPPTSSLRFLL